MKGGNFRRNGAPEFHSGIPKIRGRVFMKKYIAAQNLSLKAIDGVGRAGVIVMQGLAADSYNGSEWAVEYFNWYARTYEKSARAEVESKVSCEGDK